MPGLIEEIQRDAANSTVPIDALLRRVKLAAAKLQLSGLETWVENELNGYPDEVPKYRYVFGDPMGWNPHSGCVPIHSHDQKIMEIISRAPVAEPVGSIHDALNKNLDRSLTLPIPPANVTLLNEILSEKISRAALDVSRGHVVSILGSVRNMALEWAIEMERKGVRGEGMSFNSQERTEAHIAMTTFNIGNIGSVVGNLGIGNTSGDIHVSHQALTQVAEVVNKVRSALPMLSAEGADEQRLSIALDALEAEMLTSQPSGERLASPLSDARAALAGAVGNLTSEGALALIGAALKMLGD
jgi:hypothetical protein